MSKVELSEMEETKFNIIKTLVDATSNKKRASINLSLSLKHAYRLIEKYKEFEKKGFNHKNKNTKSANSICDETKDNIIFLYCNKYHSWKEQSYRRNEKNPK